MKFSLILLSSFLIGSPALNAAEAYRWYDGDRVRTVYLNPDTVAELGNDARTDAEIRAEFPGAKKLKQARGRMRLWRLGEKNQLGSRLAGVNQRLAAKLAGKGTPVSEVFHDRSSLRGAHRALPGGIIVTVRSDWSESRAREWLQQKGLAEIQKLNANTYSVKTSPGIASLELANQLHESGELISATPDWWVELHTR